MQDLKYSDLLVHLILNKCFSSFLVLAISRVFTEQEIHLQCKRILNENEKLHTMKELKNLKQTALISNVTSSTQICP